MDRGPREQLVRLAYFIQHSLQDLGHFGFSRELGQGGHRLGQTNAVRVRRLVMRDSIEEKVMLLQDRKRKEFERLIETPSAKRQRDNHLTNRCPCTDQFGNCQRFLLSCPVGKTAENVGG